MCYTHKKRPYKAKCIQWDTSNTLEILDTLRLNGDEAYTHGLERQNIQHIMVKFKEKLNGRPDIVTIEPSDWVVVGENKEVKTYSNAQFHIKYKEIK